MTTGGETPKEDHVEQLDFSLATKKQISAKRRSEIWSRSENLQYEFERQKKRIDWEQLRRAGSEADVNSALAGLDEFDRGRWPCTAAILATVKDEAYPKLRPIRFLAVSCALALYENPKCAEEYSPRYSRDICYEERKRRGPTPKPVTNLEYWRRQAEAGMRVPVRYLRRINKMEANEIRTNAGDNLRTYLTYADIPETMAEMKKKRTTIWLPETTFTELKKLAAVTGAPMAELFRRAVEAYLQKS